MLNSYLELAKPRLVLLALAATVSSFYLAHTGAWDKAALFLLWNTVLGAALLGGGVNALNQYLERSQDARMKRTENRPIPSGRLSKESVLCFGSAATILGIAWFYLFVRRNTAVIALALFVVYVFIYTPLKQKTALNTFVGAIAGAIPALLGWTAGGGMLDNRAWVLFAILFVWQLPHFAAISWVYREDYRKGGFRMMGLLDEKGRKTAWSIVGYSGLLLVLSLLPAMVGIGGLTYLFAAVFFGCLLVGLALYTATHELAELKKFIPASIIYLLVLNVSLMVDKL